jgi:hypothetical protein
VPRVLLLAARQPELAELLDDAGFEVALRTRPLDGAPLDGIDVAVVFRGRLIGRTQAAVLAEAGIPVVEVLTGPPTSPSKAEWIRLSSRIVKPDLVQIVHALADAATTKAARARSGDSGRTAATS